MDLTLSKQERKLGGVGVSDIEEFFLWRVDGKRIWRPVEAC